MLTCLLTSDFFTRVDVLLTQQRITEITISHQPATRLDAVLRFSHPQLTTKGSNVTIIVVGNTVTSTAPANYYFHAVPMERRDLITVLDRTIASLKSD